MSLEFEDESYLEELGSGGVDIDGELFDSDPRLPSMTHSSPPSSPKSSPVSRPMVQEQPSDIAAVVPSRPSPPQQPPRQQQQQKQILKGRQRSSPLRVHRKHIDLESEPESEHGLESDSSCVIDATESSGSDDSGSESDSDRRKRRLVQTQYHELSNVDEIIENTLPIVLTMIRDRLPPTRKAITAEDYIQRLNAKKGTNYRLEEYLCRQVVNELKKEVNADRRYLHLITPSAIGRVWRSRNWWRESASINVGDRRDSLDALDPDEWEQSENDEDRAFIVSDDYVSDESSDDERDLQRASKRATKEKEKKRKRTHEDVAEHTRRLKKAKKVRFDESDADDGDDDDREPEDDDHASDGIASDEDVNSARYAGKMTPRTSRPLAKPDFTQSQPGSFASVRGTKSSSDANQWQKKAKSTPLSSSRARVEVDPSDVDDVDDDDDDDDDGDDGNAHQSSSAAKGAASTSNKSRSAASKAGNSSKDDPRKAYAKMGFSLGSEFVYQKKVYAVTYRAKEAPVRKFNHMQKDSANKKQRSDLKSSFDGSSLIDVDSAVTQFDVHVSTCLLVTDESDTSAPESRLHHFLLATGCTPVLMSQRLASHILKELLDVKESKRLLVLLKAGLSNKSYPGVHCLSKGSPLGLRLVLPPQEWAKRYKIYQQAQVKDQGSKATAAAKGASVDQPKASSASKPAPSKETPGPAPPGVTASARSAATTQGDGDDDDDDEVVVVESEGRVPVKAARVVSESPRNPIRRASVSVKVLMKRIFDMLTRTDADKQGLVDRIENFAKLLNESFDESGAIREDELQKFIKFAQPQSALVVAANFAFLFDPEFRSQLEGIQKKAAIAQKK